MMKNENFVGLNKEDSDLLIKKLDYTYDQLKIFGNLTENSIIHGTSPLRLGNPKWFFTFEGIQNQIDKMKGEQGLIWFLYINERDGLPGVDKVIVRKNGTSTLDREVQAP